MRMDTGLRTELARRILVCLTEAVPGSTAQLRGSLAEGRADQYSDIDVLWELPDSLFEPAIDDLQEILSRVGQVESLRSDPDIQRSAKHRLLFARFAAIPLFWRLDLEAFARSINRDRMYDFDNPDARGTNWSYRESALANAIGTIKWHLRGDDAQAAESLARAYVRVGLSLPDVGLREQVLGLVDQIGAMEPSTRSLAERIRELALEALAC